MAGETTDQRGNIVRRTLSLNAQETRDLTQLIALLYEHAQDGAAISFSVLLGDDDAWTAGQEVAKWAKRLGVTND